MIVVLVCAVIAGLALAPIARRYVPTSRGSVGAGAAESYIGTALALAFMFAVIGGAMYGLAGL